MLIAVFEHDKVVSSTRKNLRARDAVESTEGAGIGESLAYANGIAMGWPSAYLWRIHGIPLVYLCNSFVLSGIDFIFGMVLVYDNRHQPRTSLLW